MSSYFLAMWLLATPASDWTPVERVVAAVDDDLVLASELDRRVALAGRELSQISDPGERTRAQTDLRRTTLDTLVDELLVAHEAARNRIEVDDAGVDRAIAMIKSANGLDDAALERAVADTGSTMAAYRTQVRHQILRLKLFVTIFRARVTITDVDLEAAHRAERATNPKLGELAAESERLRATLTEQAMIRAGERWLAEARRHVQLRP